jgi:nucleoside-diphosphate-sugar epimerase
MRVFLTGGTGYIGSAVLDALIRSGHDVTALIRGTANVGRLGSRGVTPVSGSLAEPERWREAALGFEAYVHTAFDRSPNGAEIDRRVAESLCGLAREGQAALVYTSGIWALGDTEGPADERTPLVPTAMAAFRPAVEEMVLACELDGVRPIVVRPGYVYGGGRGIISDLLKDAENGIMRIIGSGENHWPAIYDRDLGDLYARLVGTASAAGVYYATDEADETQGEIVEAIAAQAPIRPDIRRMPLDEARRKMGPYADALSLDQVVRSPRARALGWQPTLKSVARNVPRLFEEWRNAHSERA